MSSTLYMERQNDMNKEALTKHPRIWISIAAFCLGAGILISRYAAEDSGWIWLGLILSTVGGLAFLLGIYGLVKQDRQIDERFLLHRLKATRFALILGMIAMTGWLFYEALVKDVFRWDYLVVIGVIAAGKIGAMLYYRSTD